MEIMEIQFNSVYVNGGQTVVTLFMNENGKFSYMVDDLQTISHRGSDLDISTQDSVRKEILDNLAKVWGTGELYVLKRFAPLTPNFYKHIMAAWAEVRRKEADLFASK